MSTSGAVPVEALGLDASDDRSFRKLHFRLTAKLFTSAGIWMLLAVAVALNLAKHLWLSQQLLRLGAPRAVVLTIESLDFVIIALVFVTFAAMKKMRQTRTLETLRLAGCSWKEIWRPVYLLLFGFCLLDTILETTIIVISSYEPYFSDWWIWVSATILSVPLCLFVASALLLFSALRLPRGLQIVLLALSALAIMAGLDVLASFLDSFLAEHFWPSAPVQRIGRILTGQSASATPYFSSWLLQFRTTTLLSYMIGGAVSILLTLLMQSATPRASERRLLG